MGYIQPCFENDMSFDLVKCLKGVAQPPANDTHVFFDAQQPLPLGWHCFDSPISKPWGNLVA